MSRRILDGVLKVELLAALDDPAGKPILTSRAEGIVNQLMSARMNKRRQVRWSPRGARRVLQVRAAVLDGRFGHPAIQLAA